MMMVCCGLVELNTKVVGCKVLDSRVVEEWHRFVNQRED
jgi:hypothetical protein